MNDQLTLSRPRKKISLTALIDVVFILLMFFMLTSTFSQWKSITINTPVSSQTATNEQAQVVILQKDGLLEMHNKPSSKSQTIEQLKKQINKNKPLVIVPEKQTQVQTIVSTMEAFKNQGINKLSLGSPINR